MMREEWRMHANLFGARRFAAFPLVITLLTAGGVAFLTYAGIAMDTVVLGVHALVFLFGLQTGTVGFLGRDAMRDLLGDVTMLVFTSRTLPVSRRRLLCIFLLKDLLYYTTFFVVPLTLAFVPPALSLTPVAAGASASTGPLALSAIPALWLSLTMTFPYGIVVTLSLVGLSTRGGVGKAVMLGGAVALGLAVVSGVNVLAVTPYAVYADPSLATAAVGLLPVPVLAAVGVAIYDPEDSSPARTAGNTLSAWAGRLGEDRVLVARSLLDVHRSSGGLFKVLFSAGILFTVAAFLVELVTPIVGTRPSTGVAFGALLGLSAFTTYNWLTQFDDPDEYLRLPLGLEAVFAAKLRAFLVLSVPVGLAFLAGAVAWWGARPLEVVVGALLLVGLQVYLFGLVTYLTGFSPNEFLFDTVLFAGFGVAVAVPLVPVLVVGLVVVPVPTTLLAALAVGAVLAALVGLWLYRRAVPKWTAAYRSGEV
ncbi:hypothetical protein BRC81_16325 [Halobacteriales archaeon QS_1_68_20]|nr:MAG: hypothetical protein BRC81_16325 [Halobacteriales archaeon QS_1_68_20]